jgi:hypothetical protein
MTSTASYSNPAARTKLQEATAAVIEVKRAIHDAKSEAAFAPGTPPAIGSELDKALARLVEVSDAVTAATDLISPSPLSQWQIVKPHLFGKMLEGCF